MKSQLYTQNPFEQSMDTMTIDCASCYGLCCCALYFSKSDGFPKDKPSGTPCPNLNSDFRCKIHGQLQSRGLHGCMAFDCMGAGQKVSQLLYPDVNWKNAPEKAPEIYEVFLRVLRLHQMLWYLSNAASLAPAQPHLPELTRLFQENLDRTALPCPQILMLDLQACQYPVNALLKRLIQSVRQWVSPEAAAKKTPSDCIGKRFHKTDLSGLDFSMTLLIAADLSGCLLRGVSFLGADLRDADLSGADLRESIFLTQAQINGTRGDRATKLPQHLSRPSTWR